MSKLSDNLHMLREERGWTQDDVAQRLGVSKMAVSNYESGKRYPKSETLEALADLFNVDMDFLIGRSPVSARLLTSEELRIVDAYRAASEDTRDAVAAVLHVKRAADVLKDTRDA